MKRCFALPIALIALAGCGGGDGGPSATSPFSGYYAEGTVSATKFAKGSTVGTPVFTDVVTDGTIYSGGWIQVLLSYSPVDGVPSDTTINGWVSRSGLITKATVGRMLDGEPVPRDADHSGGKGTLVREAGETKLRIEFAQSDGGTLRYDVNL